MQTYYRYHGLVSLTLFMLAAAVALYAMSLSNSLAALGYGVMVIGATLGIVYAYCTKCASHGRRCRHILFGRLMRLLPSRPATPYTVWDLASVIVLTLLIVVMPQPWLWHHPSLSMLFLGLSLGAIVDTLVTVHPHCQQHAYCPVHKSVQHGASGNHAHVHSISAS